MTRLLLIVLFVCWAWPASAQISVAGFDRVSAYKQEQLGEGHFLLTGSVELERGDTAIYADSVEYFENEDRAIATGNVVVTQGNNRIAADRADFNTRTQLGIFYQASGIATVRQGRQRSPSPGGLMVPEMAQENDVYYFGETVEKIGPKKYKISNGGFSTCVQPTPRWDLTADTIILNIDRYTLLKQALLNVKGVPMLYLPFMYYPTNDEDRATGFLIPTYGISTVRGQSIHNAFFWAIDRSQDATLMYDWYSKTGSGTGGEYRYNWGGGSDGQISAYLLNQHAALYTQPDGTQVEGPGTREYTVRGLANQALPHRFRARAQVDYFSSLLTNQTFNSNVYDAARNRRTYGANVVGSGAGFFVNGTFERTEWFNNATSSGVVGSSPRISLTRSERPLFGSNSPVYFGASTEFAHLDRLTNSNGTTVDDRSLGRFDFAPQIRYPFKRWPFLTVNTTASWRETFYSRSLDPTNTTQSVVLDQSVNRQYFTVQTQLVGPVFTRVFNTPDNGYAERFKHTIEPYFNVQRTSPIDEYDRIVKIDSIDQVVGSTTSYSYGLNNRLYARRKVGQTSQPQEILAVEISQTYYTNALASRVDPTYSTSTTAGAPSNFSPIAINVRGTPSQSVDGNFRAEIDSKYKKVRQISANTRLSWRQQVQTSIGWAHSFLIPELPGYDNPENLSHYLNVTTNVQTRDRRYGAVYSFNYDVKRSAMLQSRISGFYNAQCCGIAFEYQRYNFAGLPQYLVPADHRFFLSFTLAGLGNFSPFNGAMSGVPR